jgi:hypothetical protein
VSFVYDTLGRRDEEEAVKNVLMKEVNDALS